MEVSDGKFYVLTSEEGGDSGEPVSLVVDKEEEAVKEMTALLKAGASPRGMDIYEVDLGEPGDEWNLKRVIG